MFLLCCIRICKAKRFYFILCCIRKTHSCSKLFFLYILTIVVVFVLHVETFGGLKWDFNWAKAYEDEMVITSVDPSRDPFHVASQALSVCDKSLPGLKGLKVSPPSIYRLFLFSSECVCVSSVRLSS